MEYYTTNNSNKIQFNNKAARMDTQKLPTFKHLVS